MNILNTRLAVAIISFDRPKYLRQVLKSLEGQTDLEDVDFFFVQDGSKNVVDGSVSGNQESIDLCINLWRECTLPNKNDMIRDGNYGIAMNQCKAHNDILLHGGYDACAVVEDDVVVSKNWIYLTKILLRQFKDHPQIATVQSSVAGGWFIEEDDKIGALDSVRIGRPHWYGFAMWKDKWERIWDVYQEYYEMIQQFNYQKRDHNAIRKWYKDTWNLPEGTTSQDRAKEWACVMAGMTRLFTTVNRAIYIGERGLHSTPATFKNAQFDKMVLTDFPEDEVREKFNDPDLDKIKDQIQGSLDDKDLRNGS